MGGLPDNLCNREKGKKVEISVTDFKNVDGDTLRTEAYKAHYSEVKGMGGKYSCEYADAMIPAAHTGKYGGPAELEKGLQQAFFIRTRAEKDAKAGEYTATVTAKTRKRGHSRKGNQGCGLELHSPRYTCK